MNFLTGREMDGFVPKLPVVKSCNCKPSPCESSGCSHPGLFNNAQEGVRDKSIGLKAITHGTKQPSLVHDYGHQGLQTVVSESSEPELSSGSSSLKTEWLNTEEAAEYLRIPVGTLRNLTSNGKVPHYKVPGTRLNRYRTDELRKLLFSQRRGGKYEY